MNESELRLDLEGLESAEDFLDHFQIDYEAAVVHVNRLHILQRFHDYLAAITTLPSSEAAQFTLYADQLARAYHDFVTSDAQHEKVFKVFRMGEPQQVTIPLQQLQSQVRDRAAKV